MRQDIYLATKPRYDILDGLRGVAALLVVAYHLLETHFGGDPTHPLNHGYLAVDFFFVLSGFVVGYAYDDRWDRMSLWNFAKRRLIRLHPMVILGTVFGAMMFYFGACPSFPVIGSTPWWLVVTVMLVGCTIIPMPQSMDIRGWSETNPLNGPAWSLQYEYIANALYALVFRHAGKKTLAACLVIFACLTLILTLNIDVTGFLAARSQQAYTMVGGWALTPDQLQIGFTRLLYPFFCGLLLSRCPKLRIRLRGGFWWCSLAIAALLCMPWLGLDTTGPGRWTNGLYEAVCVLLLFPLIVATGAGSSTHGGVTVGTNRFFGDISFPLYITHYPLIYMQMAWCDLHPEATFSQMALLDISLLLLAIALAYAALHLYDLPVRQWLKQRLFRHIPE